MRYHYEKPKIVTKMYGETYSCNHPVYDKCTLYLINNKGLAVIQQRFNRDNKTTYWCSIDDWLIDLLYLHPKFLEVFNQRADVCRDGLYPTITVRQLMWAMKMKPLKKERWETCFDRKDI